MFRPFVLVACCCWLLPLAGLVPGAAAQTRPLGPWRFVQRTVRQLSDDSGWGQDTITHLVSGMHQQPVAWDVSPDSIRLFRNCRNELVAPALPRAGQPAVRFVAAGASVALMTKPDGRWLAIVPSGPTVTLWAYRGQRLIFKRLFRVVRPPLPTLRFHWSWDSTYTKIGRAVMSTWMVKAEPDIAFANAMPDDARYKVFQTRLTLVRNGIAVVPPLLFDEPRLDPSSLRPLAQPGDEFHVEVQSVKRLNFRGDIEVLPLKQRFVVPAP